ncbi:MAG: dockerin type I repeat-containing protein [Planctomycetes bacterium]|nr:dockerin type I repeat-containing protein [Planctomycetota bacterium]
MERSDVRLKIGSLERWKQALLTAALLLLPSAGILLGDHSVLVEGCASTTCPHCAISAAQIHQLMQAGTHNFQYIALVINRNTTARARADEFEIEYIPHYVFDGGHSEWIGSGSLPGAYTSRIESASERDVADVEVKVEATWEAEALIGVKVDLTNHEAAEYQGRLRVYVTEIESRWSTQDGQAFHYAMVGDYAFHQDVAIAAGATEELSTFWDGTITGFGDIEKDNIAVIAAVFDGTTGLVDETAKATISPQAQIPFRRGDANADGRIDISDAVYTLGFLFLGGGEPPCRKSADADDSGSLQLTDAVRLLSHLFQGAPPLDSPFEECGMDPTEDGLTCLSFPPCQEE